MRTFLLDDDSLEAIKTIAEHYETKMWGRVKLSATDVVRIALAAHAAELGTAGEHRDKETGGMPDER